MLKRIHVRHLAAGMYIHEFCGSWMEHPFWRTRFLLRNAQDIARIRDSSIQEVWIDTAKGRDVAQAAEPVLPDEAEAQIQSALAELQPELPTTPLPQAAPLADLSPTSTSEELQRARSICNRAREQVLSMFEEARMGQAINAQGAQATVDELAGSLARNPGALISLARLKTADEYTYMHSVSVCALMMALARQLQLDEATVRMAGLAGLMHDVGKARIPDAILNKPARLSEEEFDIMRSHPAFGLEILRVSKMPMQVLDACLHHHEKMDGSGYPHRLTGPDIHLLARMSAVCDVYDAITSNRPYKNGWDPSDALRRMAEWTRGHFDSRIFQAFVKCMGIYPTGSLVRLASGHLAVVQEQSPGTLLAPRVKAFYSLHRGERIAPQLIDLSRAGAEDRIAAREDPARWGFSDLNTLWSGLPLPP
ncbi:HD-GYP domain-containing protein [Comamonas sp. NLF-1-9]|uniref:HD-GYP domain-containing protein n=1 Tax=Comamonas sp. NLF-1-9 TaxID=2853163 RepID=UPI001C484D46|nr:HD-GYP domain-containing protein [Comamonas sp. NLF-1-9]QXL83673.1 HD-GYP domain-containing protein [Comamonas sp. NLF-1-9]